MGRWKGIGLVVWGMLCAVVAVASVVLFVTEIPPAVLLKGAGLTVLGLVILVGMAARQAHNEGGGGGAPSPPPAPGL